MSSVLTGNVYEHKRTKELLHYIPKQAVALIWHEDIDGMAVEGLLKQRVKAVVNGKSSMSGTYQHENVTKLLNAGVPVYDITTIHRKWEYLHNNEVMIIGNELYVKIEGQFSLFASIQLYNDAMVHSLLREAKQAYPKQLTSFVDNTIEYVKKECAYFTEEPELPESMKMLTGQEVLIVARSPHYEKDIEAVRSRLRRKNIRIIAIDGAADGLLKNNLVPDFIIGDMDSISTQSLTCGAMILCHQHINGHCPGKERLDRLGIEAGTITFVGTSEDVAIHAAFWSGSSHLYLIGCRIGIHEFLEKGRSGMGASLLNRIQAGERLTDLKGIHRLSTQKRSLKELVQQFILAVRQTKLYPLFQSIILERMMTWKKKEAIRHE
ncbi:putative cytokinetic ring protein SteA [Bacillus solitudinis]|uniref:putative cytokinetic ring protein SteA n=1 Tax=Bacillus solitudinis TaxID=2014074 RepID=UPI000C2309FF|nr:putative cytokinetic ring protein SteA [Bacillus solitudinis]